MWGCVYPPSGHHLSSPTPIGDPSTPCALPTVHNRVSACAPDGQPKAPELKHVNNSHRFENLTWPEVNEAVEKGLIPILPVGHGRAARAAPADKDGPVDGRFGGQ